MNEWHECEIIRKSKAHISVEKLKKRLYLIIWGEKKNEAHGIRFCPYCGEKLE